MVHKKNIKFLIATICVIAMICTQSGYANDNDMDSSASGSMSTGQMLVAGLAAAGVVAGLSFALSKHGDKNGNDNNNQNNQQEKEQPQERVEILSPISFSAPGIQILTLQNPLSIDTNITNIYLTDSATDKIHRGISIEDFSSCSPLKGKSTCQVKVSANESAYSDVPILLNVVYGNNKIATTTVDVPFGRRIVFEQNELIIDKVGRHKLQLSNPTNHDVTITKIDLDLKNIKGIEPQDISTFKKLGKNSTYNLTINAGNDAYSKGPVELKVAYEIAGESKETKIMMDVTYNRELTVNPSQLIFNTAGERKIQVTNNSRSFIKIKSVKLQDAIAGIFTVDSSSCENTDISAGSVCEIKVSVDNFAKNHKTKLIIGYAENGKEDKTAEVAIEAIASVFIKTESLPIGTEGVYYDAKLELSNDSKRSLIWSADNLPAGLSIDPNTGLIDGTPRIIGEHKFTVILKDSEGEELCRRDFSIKIDEFKIGEFNEVRLNKLYDKQISIPLRKNSSERNASNAYIGVHYMDRGMEDIKNILNQEGMEGNTLYGKFRSSLIFPENEAASGGKIEEKFLHFVWVTNKNDAGKIKSLFEKHNPYIWDNIKKTKENATQRSQEKKWRCILWINDPKKLPSNIRDDLKNKGVLVKSLNKLSVKIEEAKISTGQKEKYKQLLMLVHFYIKISDFGTATDIARYLAMFLYGGMYVDGDYEIKDIAKIEELMTKYDSFYGVERPWDTRLGNAFLVSKKYGEVIKEVLNLCYRNTLLGDDNWQPEYIKYPEQIDVGVIFRTGPIALTVAFVKYKYENPNDSKNQAFGYCSVFQLNGDKDDKCVGKTILGKHDFATNWVEALNTNNWGQALKDPHKF
ncbi:MAG TPA: putative Ig domain-containing protein [Candidatus Babeliales bacterium]|nr:putative Ig domain-containing protein [Candidatus Babeliales bacterium]